MTFTDAIAALVILVLFFAGFSQAFIPALTAWGEAVKEYSTAKTIYFIAESFRQECKKPDRDIENWEKQVSVAKELESYAITEYWQEDELLALKIACVISGELIEIIGLCVQ